MTDLSTLLNKEQFEAATAPDGPLLILAAAGTGKTRTLIYRVVHLVERGYKPWELLLLTFTNRAAKEMLDRAEEVTPGITSGLWGGTFHSIANRILRKYAACMGYKSDFSILDADDQKTLMGHCIKDAGFTAKNFPKRDIVLSTLSGSINRDIDFADFIDQRSENLETKPDDIVKVVNMYIQRKRELNAMDFDDLLVNARDLLREHDDVREYYQNRFKHILVDEYQDTNTLQSEFVDMLASGHRNISVVGDDFQCIYSWRGSNYRNIMNFPERYPGANIVKLEQNYRSRPEILTVANESIKHNVEQFPKVLRPTRLSKGIKPYIYDLYSDRDQSAKMIGIIQDALSAGYKPSDIAVLYRSHFHSIDAQMALSRSGIGFGITSGLSFFETSHAKDILALMRLCEFPADRLSFDRVLNLLTGVGPAAISKFWIKLGCVFKAEDADHRNNLLAIMPPKVRTQWEPINDAITKYKTTQCGALQFINTFIDNFYGSYLKKEFENADERIDDIRELGSEIERNSSPVDFLASISLQTNVDRQGEREKDEQTPRVLLSTIHQSKGLEWPVVITLWVAEGMFPTQRSLAEEDDDSEERRLFYVMVTRAKEQLHMMVPKMRYLHDGGQMPCDKSRFLKEIPEELITKVKSSYQPQPYSASRYGSNRGGWNSNRSNNYGNNRGGSGSNWKGWRS